MSVIQSGDMDVLELATANAVAKNQGSMGVRTTVLIELNADSLISVTDRASFDYIVECAETDPCVDVNAHTSQVNPILMQQFLDGL